MLQTHNKAIVSPGGYFQTVGQSLRVNHQRMIADGFEWARQSSQDTLAVMVDH